MLGITGGAGNYLQQLSAAALEEALVTNETLVTVDLSMTGIMFTGGKQIGTISSDGWYELVRTEECLVLERQRIRPSTRLDPTKSP